MKGRMSTNYWTRKKKSEFSRVAQNFLKNSKKERKLWMCVSSECSASECSPCTSSDNGSDPCTTCSF